MKLYGTPAIRRFSIWKNVAFDGYDIELWENQTVTIVQTNIYTYEKAKRALADWQAREQERQTAQ